MTHDEKREYLIRELLSELPQYSDMEIPDNEDEQKRLLRSLMNIRSPRPISDEFLKIQDEYLSEEVARKGVTDSSSLELAADNGLKSIAFCCISTGEFRFPQKKAAEIAVRTVMDYLNTDVRIERVVFNVFKHEDYDIYRQLIG